MCACLRRWSSKFRELAGELAPDPLNADRLRLNRLLHQTPDLPDHRAVSGRGRIHC